MLLSYGEVEERWHDRRKWRTSTRTKRTMNGARSELCSRSAQILRIPPAMKAVLSRLARQRTTAATTLARIWLAERVQQELKTQAQPPRCRAGSVQAGGWHIFAGTQGRREFTRQNK